MKRRERCVCLSRQDENDTSNYEAGPGHEPRATADSDCSKSFRKKPRRAFREPCIAVPWSQDIPDSKDLPPTVAASQDPFVDW